MKNKKIVGVIVICLVVAGISFYGGMKYASSKSSASQLANRASFGQNGGTRGGAGARGGVNAGGFVTGQILSMDSTTMTVKLSNGGSKIVFYSPVTTVAKTVNGSITDVATGSQVTIIGTPNSDGSINATSVQLRPTPINGNVPSAQ